jgi:hypothetical protein
VLPPSAQGAPSGMGLAMCRTPAASIDGLRELLNLLLLPKSSAAGMAGGGDDLRGGASTT